MNCEGDNGHLRIIGGISYTYVRGTCTNDRGTPAILMRGGHVPMIGGHQLYLCEGDMYE